MDARAETLRGQAHGPGPVRDEVGRVDGDRLVPAVDGDALAMLHPGADVIAVADRLGGLARAGLAERERQGIALRDRLGGGERERQASIRTAHGLRSTAGAASGPDRVGDGGADGLATD